MNTFKNINMRNFKLIICCSLFLAIHAGIFAQTGADPSVTNPVLDPSPLVNIGDQFDISFNIGNSGAASLSGANAINKMGFTLSLGKCEPSPLGSGVAAIDNTSGVLTYFDITYDVGTKTFIGTQKTNVAIPAVTTPSIMLHVEVTQLSPNMGTSDIGAAVNIQPAPVSNPQPTGNDFASIYTYTITILPVTIKQFNAVSNGCTALIELETGVENNTADFEVQIMPEAGNWTTVKKIMAHGSASKYSASVGLTENKVNYIRLKINDKDGKSSYTEIKTLRCNGKVLITVYPNPVKNKLVIDGIPANSRLMMFDMHGKMLHSITASGTYYMNTAPLASGVYLVKVMNEGTMISVHKIVKE